MYSSNSLFLAITLIFCTNIFSQNSPTQTQPTLGLQYFRDALISHDKEKAKQFFHFPIKNPGNDLYDFVKSFEDHNDYEYDETIKTVTEKDFDLYFNRMFPKEFIECLASLDMHKFLETSVTKSEFVVKGKSTFRLYATFIKDENIIRLNFSVQTIYTNSGNGNHKAGSNRLFDFIISDTGKLIFKQFMIVG